jgi:hypothetical protein
MFESPVDRFGRTVAGAWAIEVGQDVSCSALEGPPQGDELDQRAGDAVAERRDEPDHEVAALLLVGLAVGADHPLVDPPGGFDLDVGITGEQGDEALFLLVGEQALTGVQGAARTVERILGVAAVAVQALLDPTAALVESVAGEAHDVARGPSPRSRRGAPRWSRS